MERENQITGAQSWSCTSPINSNIASDRAGGRCQFPFLLREAMVACKGIPRREPEGACSEEIQPSGAQLSSQKRADCPFPSLILIKGNTTVFNLMSLFTNQEYF
ncbi:hypothetical protein DY000_02052736 [Brassica cretica]|uniref:Uncharacterized protein n=1 Tax=Brassica cretica TaxID=69181 RepID=A0ABQ7A840_BRACR|nr:hypothetical protein DY000_02052736 [Brassica cretica]